MEGHANRCSYDLDGWCESQGWCNDCCMSKKDLSFASYRSLVDESSVQTMPKKKKSPSRSTSGKTAVGAVR